MKICIKSLPSLSVLLVVILVMQTFLLKIPVFFEMSWLKSLDEIVVLVAACYILLSLRKKTNAIVIFSVKLSIIFGLFCFMGIVSGFINNLSATQILMQLVLELKLLITIVFCLFAFDGNISNHFLNKLFRTLVLINFPFVIWQLTSSGSYDSFFATGSHFALFYDLDGGEYTRVAGIFWFTGAFAVFCALSSGYFIIRNFSTKRLDSNTMFLSLSLFMLLATRSNGELYGFIFGVLVLLFCSMSTYGHRFLVIIVTTITLGFLFYLNSEFYFGLAGQLGFISGLPEYSARALFMITSLDIAWENFPFGAGFGSFGGQSAVVHDSALFYKYYISQEWYFSEGLFLTDTFWPKIIAESGWIGFVLMCIFLLYPFSKCYNNRIPHQFFSIFSLAFMFFQSLSAPIYNEPLSVMLSFFLLGGIFENENKAI
jgi:hypothetical protein